MKALILSGEEKGKTKELSFGYHRDFLEDANGKMYHYNSIVEIDAVDSYEQLLEVEITRCRDKLDVIRNFKKGQCDV